MTTTHQAQRYTFGDYDEAVESYFDRGWTDGLPIVPPTLEKVESFLHYAGLSSDEVIGHVPTREVTVTAEQVAVNAVMAGCKAEYMPVVMAATRALL
ncbi:MAG: thioredoxin, partial [Dehalococcoidia bacterium]